MAWEGDRQTDTQTDTRTCRQLDQLGPEGRVNENLPLVPYFHQLGLSWSSSRDVRLFVPSPCSKKSIEVRSVEMLKVAIY